MEEHPFNNVNNYLNTNTYSYLETSGGQSSNLYLNLVHFLNTSVNYLWHPWQLKAVVFLHWCLMCTFLKDKSLLLMGRLMIMKKRPGPSFRLWMWAHVCMPCDTLLTSYPPPCDTLLTTKPPYSAQITFRFSPVGFHAPHIAFFVPRSGVSLSCLRK